MATPSRDPLETWYRQRTGKAPRGWHDVEALHYQEFLALNPRERKFGELVVTYAEEKRGKVLEFLRAFHPQYWGGGFRSGPVSDARRSIGLSQEEAAQIYYEMYQWVKPRWKASAEYADQPAELRFPEIS